MIKEYSGKETYKNKKAMAKHEKAEPAKMEKSEGYKCGGKVAKMAKGGMVMVKGKNC